MNNLVEQYLLFAERQAMRRISMHMEDWIVKLEDFLRLNDENILTHAGKISHEMALAHAEHEYNKFHEQRQSESHSLEGDFERSVKSLTGENSKETPA